MAADGAHFTWLIKATFIFEPRANTKADVWTLVTLNTRKGKRSEKSITVNMGYFVHLHQTGKNFCGELSECLKDIYFIYYISYVFVTG